MNVRRILGKWIGSTVCVGITACSAGSFSLAEDTVPKQQSPIDADVRATLEEQDIEVLTVQVGRLNQSKDAPDDTKLPIPRRSVEMTLIDDLSHAHQGQANGDSEGKYWIGLICVPSNEALRTHLDLDAQTGLLVEEVYDDGPAKKSGMLRHDLLLSATLSEKGEPVVRRLNSVSELTRAVQAAETNTLKLEFLRRGRKQSLDVVPQERPQTVTGVIKLNTKAATQIQSLSHGHLGLRWAGPMVLDIAPPSLPEGMTLEFIPADGPPEKVKVTKGEEIWEAEIKGVNFLPKEIEGIVRQHLDAKNAAYARAGFFHGVSSDGQPSIVIHRMPAALPPNVTITTVRTGAEPVKITVKRDDQTWDISEKDLSKLPMELRPFAQIVLSGLIGGPPPFTRAQAVVHPHGDTPYTTPVGAPIRMTAPPHVASEGPGALPPVKTVYRPVPDQADMARQLKELTEQVQKLRQAVERTQPKQ